MNKMSLLVRAALVGASIVIMGAGCSISVRTGSNLDGGSYRSADGGVTWSQVVNAGKNAKGKPIRIDNMDVQFIRFDPKNSATIYLSTIGSGIYRSDTSGDLWVRTGIAAATYKAFTIDPESTSILYAATGGTILKSADGGAQWTVIYRESDPARAFTNLTINPTSTGTLYAATNKAEVLLSKDYGNTWQLFSTLGVADTIKSLFFAPSSGSVMYALTQTNGLYKSITAGQTWVSLKPNLAKFQHADSITSIAVLPNKPDILYIGSGYGLLMTTDGGTSWQPIQTLVPFSSQAIQQVAVNPNNPSIIYVMVGNKLRKSIDGGKTWDAKILIPTSRSISTMALNVDKPDELFVGTLKPKK